MRKCIVCTVLLLANSIVGMDGIEYLKKGTWFGDVSVTSTSLVLKIKDDSMIIVQDDSYRKYCEAVLTNAWAKPWRQAAEFVENDKALLLTPDQETHFMGHGGTLFLSPVSYKNKQQGFRVLEKFYNHRGKDWVTFNTAYLALSDTPMEVGEDDVEMVMDKGKWVTARDWRKNMELDEKYGWPASHLVQYAEKIMREAKEGELLVHEPTISNIWNKLVEDGIIKTNTVEKEGKAVSPSQKKKGRIAASLPSREGNDEEQRRGETSSPYRLWLYVGVSLCALCAILYFLRRKLKTGN